MCKQKHRQQQNLPGVVVGAAVVVGWGEGAHGLQVEGAHQSHSLHGLDGMQHVCNSLLTTLRLKWPELFCICGARPLCKAPSAMFP